VTVDYASRALVHIAKQESSLGGTFHLWNIDAMPTTSTYDWVRSFGYDFTIVPFAAAIDQAMRVDPSHPLYPLLPVLFLYNSGDAGLPMSWEDHLAVNPESECAKTLDALGGSGLECAPLTEKWMHDCLSFLIRRKQLQPPAKERALSLARA
jgi:hypothetical protein